MTGVGGVTFRAPVMLLVGTGFVARSGVVAEEEEKEEEEARVSGEVGENEESDVASDVCSPKHVEEVLSSPEPARKPDSVTKVSQPSIGKALKRASLSSSSSNQGRGLSGRGCS